MVIGRTTKYAISFVAQRMLEQTTNCTGDIVSDPKVPK
jgi:hypothetical protein